MSRLIDLTGQRFGRLTVIGRSFNYKSNRVRWLCKCDCSVEKSIDGCNLRSGLSKSCGCLRNESHRLPLGVARMRSLINTYRQNVKRKGLVFELTEGQFAELTQKDCHYCGARANNISKSKGFNGKYIYTGIDRIDNTKGYTIENVVPCCHTCNEAKSDHTLREFKDWIKRVYNKLFED